MKKISKEKLQEIVKSHGKWWRNEDGGQRAYLRDANLRGADLQRTDLQGADLQGANLRYANLQGADLQRTDLQGANLRGACLRDAKLQGANLRGVCLRDANLRGADLQRTDLQGANLRGADLQRTNLRGAYLPNGIYQVVGCGSENRCTTYDSINDHVICGCWDDENENQLESFEQHIKAIYGTDGENPNQQYFAEYMAAIAFFKKLRK